MARHRTNYFRRPTVNTVNCTCEDGLKTFEFASPQEALAFFQRDLSKMHDLKKILSATVDVYPQQTRSFVNQPAAPLAEVA